MTDVVTPVTLAAALDRAVEASPDAPFLVQVETGQKLTFAQTRDVVDRLAGALQARGVERNDIVATMLFNGVASAAAWFACSRIGAVEAPIGTAYKGVLFERLLELSEARVLIIDASLIEGVRDVITAAGRLEHVIVVGATGPEDYAGLPLDAAPWEAVIAAEPVAQAVELGMDDIACMLFTSGTTGGSRGVLCTYAQEFEGAVAAPGELAPGDVTYSTSPPNHVGQKLTLYRAVITGTTYVMRGTFSLREFWSDIAEYGCTNTLLLGGATSYLLAQEDQGAPAEESPLNSVIMIPIHPEYKAFRERFGVAVHSLYNMTEICPIAVITDSELVDHRSSGRVRPGFDWKLVGADGHAVAEGEAGELLLRPHVRDLFSRGYFRDEQKTAEAWDGGWFHTGDVFQADSEGYLYFIDRAKDVVRRRGENVSSAELEYIVSQHPGVEECAVVGVPSEHTEEDIKVVVVGRDGFADAWALREHLIANVPRFMLPRYVQFVSELPKTPTLKVRKSALREDMEGSVTDFDSERVKTP